MSDIMADDRKTGLRMAIAAGAQETAEVIKDPNAGFPQILSTAVRELGAEGLVKQLVQAPPLWAHVASNFLDLTDAQRALLSAHADSAPILTPPSFSDDLAEQAVARAESFGGPLSAYNIHNEMAAVIQWTVLWRDSGKQQPTTAYPDQKKWRWSGDVTAPCHSQIPVARFAAKVPNAKLSPGDSVWVYIWVSGGNSLNTEDSVFQFTYDPTSAKVAYLTASGTTLNGSISLTDYK